MTKNPAHFFELKVSRERKLLLTLPSGLRCMFYRGKPGRNAITDERDVRYLRQHPSFLEVAAVSGGKGKGAPQMWVPVEEAQRYAQRRAQRKVTSTAKEAGGPATAGGGTPPPADRDPAPKTLDERILEIILSLDSENPEHFTQGGKPSVLAIEAALGQNITAEDRDRVWGAIETEGSDAEGAG